MVAYINSQPAPSQPFTPVIDELTIANGSPLTISAANTVVHNPSWTQPNGSTRLRCTWSVRLFESNGSGGPWATAVLKLDTVQVWPRGDQTSTHGTNPMVAVSQNNPAEWHTVSFWLTGVTAGNHQMVLTLSNNVGSVGTLALMWSALVMEFYP